MSVFGYFTKLFINGKQVKTTANAVVASGRDGLDAALDELLTKLRAMEVRAFAEQVLARRGIQVRDNHNQPIPEVVSKVQLSFNDCLDVNGFMALVYISYDGGIVWCGVM